jgi:EAL domain-containing protein (putative c-di-GMP-specific phosphodiesterase class I)
MSSSGSLAIPPPPPRGLAPARPGPGLLLVARDPAVIAAARQAARQVPGRPGLHLVTGDEALRRLVGPGAPPSHLVLEHGAAEGALLSAARDRFIGTEVVVIARAGAAAPAGLRASPPDATRLAAALAAVPPGPAPSAADPAALAAGLARGEITVRFQPMVRLGDRQPVLFEALARWERPALALAAGAFVGLAERGGLALPLALAVAARALAEFAPLRGAGAARLSVNVPLAVMVHPDLPARLAALLAAAGCAPGELMLELTEGTRVRDTALLRRALDRLGRAGFEVLLDDLGANDARAALLGLPFAGVKLDRSLIAALPSERRARAQVERLVRRSHAEGRAVVAEGVTDPLLWRAAAAAGCDLAQGFGVGRPIPPEAMPAWISAWSGAALPEGR